MGIYTLFSVLILIACILLILIVLVQNSKGGGLAANFSASAQIMGVRKTADFLEKATWTLAISLLLFSLFASASIPRGAGEDRSRIEEQIERAIDPTAVPNLPTALPEPEGSTSDDQNK
jgi:preprotein translocase subunit SecG